MALANAQFGNDFHNDLPQGRETRIVVQMVVDTDIVVQQNVVPAGKELNQRVYLQGIAYTGLALHQWTILQGAQFQRLDTGHFGADERIHQGNVAAVALYLANQFAVSIYIIGKENQASLVVHLSHIDVGEGTGR